MRQKRLQRFISACMAVIMLFSNSALVHAAVNSDGELVDHASASEQELQGREKLTENLLKVMDLVDEEYLIDIIVDFASMEKRDMFKENYLSDGRGYGEFKYISSLYFEATKAEILEYAKSDYVQYIASEKYIPDQNLYNYGGGILSEEAANQIRQDFIGDANLLPEEVIIRYYGTYSGCEVVCIEIAGEEVNQVSGSATAGKYTFEFGLESLARRFFVHKDHEFIPIQEAYDNGILTEGNLALLARNFSAAYVEEDGVRRQVLCVGTERSLKTLYLEKIQNENPDDAFIQSLTTEDIAIARYYGDYNGRPVFIAQIKNLDLEEKETKVQIGDFEFTFPNEHIYPDSFLMKTWGGELVTIEEAHEKGDLQRYDLSVIWELHELDNQTKELRMKKDYLKMLKIEHPDEEMYQELTLEDIKLYNFYKLSDERIIFCSLVQRFIGATVETRVDIGGHEFVFPGGGSGFPDNFLYWEYGQVYTVEEAFEKGVLSQEDIDEYCDARGCAPIRRPIPFDDVLDTDWFYPAVDALFAEKIMTGMGEDFGPYEQFSRAQLVVILYRMEEEPKFETEKSFSDISGNEWYGPATLWAAENDIVTGYENGNFGPADYITREQMAVMMYRYAKYLEQDVSTKADIKKFADADKVSDFATEALAWANGMSIITGKEDGTLLDPQGNTTRCEAAVVIHRFMENIQNR